MAYLSKRVSVLHESATIRMAQLSRELKSQGKDIIDLSLGEPDFDTPDYIRASAKKAIDEGFSHYTPVAGYLDVREAVCAKFKRDNGLHYTPDQIVLSTGAKQSIINAVLSLVDPGDEVILPAPYWVSYPSMVQIAEGKIVEIASTIDNDFKMQPAQLEKAITDHTRLLLFSSPCNPTGTMYTKEELRAFADIVLRKKDMYIISDEIYEYIHFAGTHTSIAAFDDVYDRVITVNGLSKAFAMTGWRLGYIGAPVAVAKACDKIQGQFTSAPNSITQRAAITALRSDHGPVLAMKDAFIRRRDLVLRLLNDIPGLRYNIPQGAFYFFLDISSYFGKQFETHRINNAEDLCMYLLHTAHISLVPGTAFGDANCIRLSYATSDTLLKEALSRMQKAFAQLAPVSHSGIL